MDLTTIGVTISVVSIISVPIIIMSGWMPLLTMTISTPSKERYVSIEVTTVAGCMFVLGIVLALIGGGWQ